jgi:hypothetical protein
VFEKGNLYSVCKADNQVINTHPTNFFMSKTRPLKLLHVDLFGVTTNASVGGKIYCLVVVDNYSRYV